MLPFHIPYALIQVGLISFHTCSPSLFLQLNFAGFFFFFLSALCLRIYLNSELTCHFYRFNWCSGTLKPEHHTEVLFLQCELMLQLHRGFTITEAIRSNEYL